MARKNSVYFNGCTTLEELTNRLSSLILEYENDTATIIAFSLEYDKLFEVLKKEHNKDKEEKDKIKDKPEELRNVAFRTLTYKDEEKGLDFKRDCVLELRGHWFYVYAKEGKDPEITRLYAELLYANGLHFKFSKRIKQAYWFSGIEKAKWHRHGKGLTVEESRRKHGYKIIETEEAV